MCTTWWYDTHIYFLKKLTTIRLAKLLLHICNFFVCVMRTFMIYSLNYFQDYNWVLIILTMHKLYPQTYSSYNWKILSNDWHLSFPIHQGTFLINDAQLVIFVLSKIWWSLEMYTAFLIFFLLIFWFLNYYLFCSCSCSVAKSCMAL